MSDTPLFDPDDPADDVEAILRELEASDLDLTPAPADVWDAIEAELSEDTEVEDHRQGTVVSLSDRRSRLRVGLLSAVAALALIAVGAVVVASFNGNAETTVASAELVHEVEFDPAGADASATANLLEREGSYEIDLTNADLPNPESDDLELWLIAVEDDGSLDVQPVSLVNPTSPGIYRVPPEIDPAVHSIVDISIEPRDGVETHSGRSILRGELAEV